MTLFRWVLRDASGAPVRVTETFSSRQEAEAHMAAAWESMAADGVESVALTSNDDVVYEMDLGPARE